MLRKFKISIDGKEYLVEMEEIGGVQQPVAPQVQQAAPVEVPQADVQPVAKEEVAPVVSTPAGADALVSPMPGTILKVLVAVGDEVKENQPLMILEAMKMENEIVANKSGKIVGIHTKQGEIVNPGDALLTIG